MSKSVCFDVLGTCFGFEKAIDTIEERLGKKLEKVNVDSKSFFFSWFYAAQRDFTYCSIVDSYVPIAQILSKTFKRACLIVDLPEAEVADDDVVAVMGAIKGLEARVGLKECYDGLRADGWNVYGVTNGGSETSLGYYQKADIELATTNLMSCDDLRKAKPDLAVYESAKKAVTTAGCTGENRWFVAAHAWVS